MGWTPQHELHEGGLKPQSIWSVLVTSALSGMDIL